MSDTKRSRAASYVNCRNSRTVSQYVMPEASATTVMPTSRNDRTSRRVMERDMLFACKAVADAEDGLHIVRLRGIGFDLGAQVADMLVDGAGDALERGALQRVEQLD